MQRRLLERQGRLLRPHTEKWGSPPLSASLPDLTQQGWEDVRGARTCSLFEAQATQPENGAQRFPSLTRAGRPNISLCGVRHIL